jgi:hypothetical protein
VALTLIRVIFRLRFFKKFGERRQYTKVVHCDKFIFEVPNVFNVSKTDAVPTWGSFVPQKVQFIQEHMPLSSVKYDGVCCLVHHLSSSKQQVEVVQQHTGQDRMHHRQSSSSNACGKPHHTIVKA